MPQIVRGTMHVETAWWTTKWRGLSCVIGAAIDERVDRRSGTRFELTDLLADGGEVPGFDGGAFRRGGLGDRAGRANFLGDEGLDRTERAQVRELFVGDRDRQDFLR